MLRVGKFSWNTLIEENQYHSLTTFIRIALNENAKRAKILWTISEKCLNPGSLQEQKKSYLVQGNLTQISLQGPMMWKVMQRNVWSDIANKTTQQLYKVATPCLDDHQFKEEELGSVGELSEVCSLFSKCLYLARIGRPQFYGR